MRKVEKLHNLASVIDVPADELEVTKKELQDVSNEVLMLQKFFLATSQLHFKLERAYVYKMLGDILKEYVGCRSYGIFLTKSQTALDLVFHMGDQKVFEGMLNFIMWSIEGGRAYTHETPSREFLFEQWKIWAKKNEIGSQIEAEPLAIYPLKTFDETIGAVVILSLLDGKEKLVDQDYRFLELLADHAANAIVASRLHEEMKELVLEKTQDLNKLNQNLAEINAQLQRTNKELEQFTNIASHDLKAPLRTISAFSDFLYKEYRDKMSKEGQEYLQTIQRSTGKMKILIDDLLKFSRVGRTEMTVEAFSLQELLSETLDLLKTDIQKKQARIEIPKDSPLVSTVRHCCQEVFLNLISNALKYNDKKSPQVEIQWRELADKRYEFKVSDNGIGIDPQYFECIFEPFRRLHTADKYEGTGMGLAIVKKIVNEVFHEEILVNSGLGKGTQFTFVIKSEGK